MNEMCGNCGMTKKDHETMSCEHGFAPSGLVAVTKEFVAAVEELVGPYYIHINATIFDKIDLLDEKMKKVSALLAQMKKEG